MIRRAALLALAASLAACGHDTSLPAAPGPVDDGDGTISGRVVVEEAGTPLPVAAAATVVQVLDPEGAVRAETAADAEGRFAVFPGDVPWTVLFRFDADGDGAFERQRLVASSELPLLPGADLSLGDVLVGENAELRGTVRRGDVQNPDAGHGGVLVEVIGAPFPAVVTGSDGSFRVRDLPPGSLTVGFSLAGYVSDARSAELEAGESQALVEVVLAPESDESGSLTGTIVRDDAAPGTAIVEARRSGDVEPSGRLVVALGQPFTLAPLPPGTYAVRAVVPDYGSGETGGIELAASGTVELGTLTVQSGTVIGPEPDGAAIVDVEPSTAQLLPALGLLMAELDTELELNGEGQSGPQLLLLADEDGVEVQGEQSYRPAGTQLPDGSVTVRPAVFFQPKRPLTPGRWTLSLREGLRDVLGRAVKPSPRTWTTIGPELAPTVLNEDFAPNGATWPTHPALVVRDDGGFDLLKVRTTEDPAQGIFSHELEVMTVDAIGRNGGFTVAGTLDVGPEPRRAPQAARILDQPLYLVAGPSQLCGRDPEAVDLRLSNGFGDEAVLPCVKRYDVAGGASPLLVAFDEEVAGAPRLRSFSIVRDNGTGGLLLTEQASVALPQPLVELQLSEGGGRRFVSVTDGGFPRFYEATAGALTPLGDPLPIIWPQTSCTLGGAPFVLEAQFDKAQSVSRLVPRVLDLDTGAWIELPTAPAVFPDTLACVGVGEVVYVAFTDGDRLELRWSDGTRWERIADRTTPDGALNYRECWANGPVLEVDKGSLLVAWNERCFDRVDPNGNFLENFARVKRIR